MGCPPRVPPPSAFLAHHSLRRWHSNLPVSWNLVNKDGKEWREDSHLQRVTLLVPGQARNIETPICGVKGSPAAESCGVLVQNACPGPHQATPSPAKGRKHRPKSYSVIRKVCSFQFFSLDFEPLLPTLVSLPGLSGFPPCTHLHQVASSVPNQIFLTTILPSLSSPTRSPVMLF